MVNLEYTDKKIVLSKIKKSSKTNKFFNLIVQNIKCILDKDVIIFDTSGNIYKSNENIKIENNIINKFKNKNTYTYFNKDEIFPIYINGYLYGGIIIVGYTTNNKKILNSYINLIEKYIEE